MSLAIFDLDNTLLGGDSDHAWGEFIVAHRIVDPDEYKARNDQFFNDYLAGRLDIRVYLNFCLQLLGEHPTEQLDAWHQQFMQEKILPIVLPKALALIERHRQAGDGRLVVGVVMQVGSRRPV